MLSIGSFLNPAFQIVITMVVVLTIASILISLAVTFYIYDYSSLYTLDWLNKLNIKKNSSIINIHAGFDETSESIQHKFSPKFFKIFDFYDPQKHTEISIKRARKRGYIFPGTKTIDTEKSQFNSQKVDYIFLLLAAHEIRNDGERITFFLKLQSLLNRDGKIIVAEHLRNIPNFFAYNIGTFHFFSKYKWKSTFEAAGFNTVSEIKINKFMTAFILNQE
ncbi:MAG TPA: methyltransferase [Parafilimonas sp.]